MPSISARDNAIDIFNAAVESVQAKHLIPAHLFIEQETLHIFDHSFNVKNLPGIYVIGAGKAAAAMAQATENIIAPLISEGLVTTKYGHAVALQKIRCNEAAHPVPDGCSIEATNETLALLKKVSVNDIVICLISGGASSLWADLCPGSSLEETKEVFESLLKSGASIEEVNAVRKHLSAVKGGQLLRYAPGAYWFTFIISDVPGNRLDAIASGPTVPDTSTFADVKTILGKYALTGQLPASVLQHITNGFNGRLPDTPKAGDPMFNKVFNKIIGSNAIALQAAQAKAIGMAFHVPFVEDNLNGDAAKVGREFTRSCKKYAGIKPACFLLAGETTVTVKGRGKGGRNQHMALSALCEMAINDEPSHDNKITFLSAGTDGTDGPTDTAGAIADLDILSVAVKHKLDAVKYLDDNDAYHFFEKAGGLFKTGPTYTNVMDLVVVIVE